MMEGSAIMRGMKDELANAQAEEIIRLRAENERLRAALIEWRRADWYEDYPGTDVPKAVLNARWLTRAALEEKP